MSPKSLTDEEKNSQRERLLLKGQEFLATYGVRKTSIEDITKSAKMAKGTFYQHFSSKEHFFFEVLVQLHSFWFKSAEEFLLQASAKEIPLPEQVREIIKTLFHSQHTLSVLKYHDELEDLVRSMQNVSSHNVTALAQMELDTYQRLLKLFDIDTQRVKAGVISNYIHTVYFCLANADQMDKESLDETFEAMLDGLILYIFGGS